MSKLHLAPNCFENHNTSFFSFFFLSKGIIYIYIMIKNNVHFIPIIVKLTSLFMRYSSLGDASISKVFNKMCFVSPLMESFGILNNIMLRQCHASYTTCRKTYFQYILNALVVLFDLRFNLIHSFDDGMLQNLGHGAPFSSFRHITFQ